MSDATTIKLSQSAKKELDKAQLPGETYEQTVLRLLDVTDGQAWTEDEIREIVEDVLHQRSRGQV